VRVRGFGPRAGERADRQLRQRTLYQTREPPQPGILPDRGPDEIRLVAKRRERCFERLRLSALADAIEAREGDDCSAAWPTQKARWPACARSARVTRLEPTQFASEAPGRRSRPRAHKRCRVLAEGRADPFAVLGLQQARR